MVTKVAIWLLKCVHGVSGVLEKYSVTYCLGSVLSVCVFIVVSVAIRNIGCVFVSIVKNNIPLTVPRGISPPFHCSTRER